MKILALAGGVGGAKLADGLSQVLAPENLTIVVNTGDDFVHFGLKICPDIDTVCYTLGGLANSTTGWGRESESWTVMQALARLGGPTWFNLGDQDLATHLERTRRLQEGQRLTEITQSFCKSWGIGPTVIPMTDDFVATWVETIDGELLPFQEYFVHQQCEPIVSGFVYKGIENAYPAPGILNALDQADAVVICPSNPWVSIGPILGVNSLRENIAQKVVVAVSPIVGGKAIKGPAAKMYQELGIQPSALVVARQYEDLLSGFIMDEVDREMAEQVEAVGIRTLVTDTIMKSTQDRRYLAEKLLHFCGEILEGMDPK